MRWYFGHMVFRNGVLETIFYHLRFDGRNVRGQGISLLQKKIQLYGVNFNF